MTKRPHLLLAGLTAALLAGCGTTVPVTEQVSVQGPAGGTALSGPAVAGGTAGSTAPATSGGPAAALPAATAAALPGSAASVPSAGPAATGSAPVDPARAAAAPTTKKPVEVGVVIFPDVNKAAAMFGGSASVGDQKGEVTDAIGWANAHGGLDGHRIVPVFFEVSLTSTQTYAQTYQQICASFTQDHHVVATMFVGNAEAQLPACLAKGGSLYLAHGHYLHAAKDFTALPNMVTPEDAGSDRVAQAMVDQLLARKVVPAGGKLGLMVMSYTGPQHARDAVLVPQLKAHGIDVVSYEVGYPQSTQDISNSAAAVQNAELKMAAAGIKTVAFLCPGCASFFVQDAESQGYYPRYVLTSYDTLGGVKGTGHTKSYTGALALGWDPVRDVGTYADPGPLAGNSTYALCRTVEKANIHDDTTLFASEAFCGQVMDLYAAARANPAESLTGASLMTGFDRLGTSHDGAANLATELGPDRHDGVAAYRTLHYDATADAFLYDAGSPLRLP